MIAPNDRGVAEFQSDNPDDAWAFDAMTAAVRKLHENAKTSAMQILTRQFLESSKLEAAE